MWEWIRAGFELRAGIVLFDLAVFAGLVGAFLAAMGVAYVLAWAYEIALRVRRKLTFRRE